MTTILVAFVQQFWLAIWALVLLILLFTSHPEVLLDSKSGSPFKMIDLQGRQDQSAIRQSRLGKWTGGELKTAVAIILILDQINQVTNLWEQTA